MVEKMLRIFMADDHALVREGLKRILNDEFGTVLYGEAENGLEVMDEVRKQDWDILILDITMPGRSGFDLLKDLKSEVPALPVLVLSMHPEDPFCLRVLEAGASGYVTKERAARDVVTAVKKVLAGEKYVSPSFAEKIVLDLAAKKARPVREILSNREVQVLSMIASGKRLSQIAETLSLSIKTVSTYRMRLLTKLKMSTNVELAEYATRNGII
jgi:two-component system invasion response regulator UvrY